MVDRQEYERVAQELLPTLYKIAMGILRADADARDAVQQALLKAWEKRGGARSGSFRGFLTRIVINECRNIQRERMRVFPADLNAMPAASAPPDYQE
ncbi:MAG: sigma factor, partial [Christensenellales bacterium]|nr:sigma factor [Christensenellales bacterium]